MMESSPQLAAIEAGGTKFAVAVGSSVELAHRTTFQTTNPDETMRQVVDFISAHGPIDAIGVAAFGPINVDKTAAQYGVVGRTPKAGWSGFSYLQALSCFGVPVAIDSDVNVAALAEATQNPDTSSSRTLYITVGTGIGVGVVDGGHILNGTGHPEMGHMVVPQHADDPLSEGCCPFHAQCVEGLASGPSILKRWGSDLSSLPEGHRAHQIEAFYLACLSVNLIVSYRPQVIFLGGGVAQTPGLRTRVIAETHRLLGSYLPELDSVPAVEQLIRTPQLAPDSGIAGAFLLAGSVVPTH